MHPSRALKNMTRDTPCIRRQTTPRRRKLNDIFSKYFLLPAHCMLRQRGLVAPSAA
jgi:hypothetical protein